MASETIPVLVVISVVFCGVGCRLVAQWFGRRREKREVERLAALARRQGLMRRAANVAHRAQAGHPRALEHLEIVVRDLAHEMELESAS